MAGEVKTYTAHMRFVKRLVKSSRREKPKFSSMQKKKETK